MTLDEFNKVKVGDTIYRVYGGVVISGSITGGPNGSYKCYDCEFTYRKRTMRFLLHEDVYYLFFYTSEEAAKELQKAKDWKKSDQYIELLNEKYKNSREMIQKRLRNLDAELASLKKIEERYKDEQSLFVDLI